MFQAVTNLWYNRKVRLSVLSALVFMAVSLPQTYGKTDELMSTLHPGTHCPSPSGKFIHTGIFFVLLYCLMKFWNANRLTNGVIAKYSFFSALLFFMITSSDTYALTSTAPGLNTLGMLDASGCPTVNGVFVHAIVFMALLIMIMYFPGDCHM